jgi:hypothetical protein
VAAETEAYRRDVLRREEVLLREEEAGLRRVDVLLRRDEALPRPFEADLRRVVVRLFDVDDLRRPFVVDFLRVVLDDRRRLRAARSAAARSRSRRWRMYRAAPSPPARSATFTNRVGSDTRCFSGSIGSRLYFSTPVLIRPAGERVWQPAKNAPRTSCILSLATCLAFPLTLD